MVEQLTLNQWVRGSSPRSVTLEMGIVLRDIHIFVSWGPWNVAFSGF
jgi:hypothetical protein